MRARRRGVAGATSAAGGCSLPAVLLVAAGGTAVVADERKEGVVVEVELDRPIENQIVDIMYYVVRRRYRGC